jgi:large subunit ribosomal protein L15
MPKRGFTNIFAKNWAEVNVDMLQRFFKADDVVNLDSLRAVGLATKTSDGIRVLGRGELSIALKVEAAHVTAGAKKKIEAAGGSVNG